MDLNTAAAILSRYFEDELGIRYKLEYENEALVLQSHANLRAFGNRGDVDVEINVYPNSAAYLCFYFGKLSQNSYTLQLLHTFNQTNLFFKAYIQNGELVLDHPICVLEETSLLPYVSNLFALMAGEDTLRALEPLVNLTE